MAVLQEYKCPCCDGAIEFDSTSQKMKCPYCGSEFEIETLKAYANAENITGTPAGICHARYPARLRHTGGWRQVLSELRLPLVTDTSGSGTRAAVRSGHLPA